MKLGNWYSIIYQPIHDVSLDDIAALEKYLADDALDLEWDVPASRFYGDLDRLITCGVSYALYGLIFEAIMQNADRIVFIGG